MGHKVESETSMYSVCLPSLSLQQSTNDVSTGAIQITLLGANVNHEALSPKSRSCISSTEKTDWISDSAVTCQIQKGTKKSHFFSVSTGIIVGSLSDSFSGCLSLLSALEQTNVVGTGSVSVTILGAALGNSEHSGFSRLLSTSSEQTKWISQTAVQAKSPQGTAFTRICVVSAGVELVSGTDSASYDEPALSIAFPINNPAEGSLTFTIFGKMFGMLSRSIISRLGGTGCEASAWFSDTSVLCKLAAGIKGTQRVTVTSKRKVGTRTEIFSYNAPGLSSSSPINSATTGNRVFFDIFVNIELTM
jgi:hypothetical protein